jgi:hypothetical protein
MLQTREQAPKCENEEEKKKFFFSSLVGVKLSPLGTSATNRPIVPATHDR